MAHLLHDFRKKVQPVAKRFVKLSQNRQRVPSCRQAALNCRKGPPACCRWPGIDLCARNHPKSWRFYRCHQQKGEGSTFDIFLPAAETSFVNAKMVMEAPTAAKRTILLADDDEIIKNVCGNMVVALGYEVLIADSGFAALEIFKQNAQKIDLVILDMIMPDMSGADTYERLKELDSGVKVLLFSGCGTDAEPQKILARGCDGFLQKPFGLKELSNSIRQLLEQP